MIKTVFFGTGKLGHDVLLLWKRYDMTPDFFSDNNENMWGEKVEGIEVISPNTLFAMCGNVRVFVTCRFWNEVRKQLLANGISEKNIIRADAIHASEMLQYIEDKIIQKIGTVHMPTSHNGYLIDLSSGMVLGGVERWSYSLAAKLSRNGINGAYLLPDDVKGNVLDNKFPTLMLNRIDSAQEYVYYESCISSIINSGYLKVVCNFPFEIMIAACYVKKYYRQELELVFVIHNDEEMYYRISEHWDKYIDKYYAISKKIQRKLMGCGISEKKIKMLYWDIPCEQMLNREYSTENQPIKLAYAGRVTIQQKRMDIMLQVLKKLKHRGILYQMEIAGAGDYLETFVSEVIKYGLSDYVKFVGIVPHENILDFWKQQDICLSCSDFEGHSISQSEAMAAGAVLVITNTSGTEDDVESGYNGYVVDIGDVDGIVEKIQFLDKNRNLLKVMGQRSHEIICERNQMMKHDII